MLTGLAAKERSDRLENLSERRERGRRPRAHLLHPVLDAMSDPWHHAARRQLGECGELHGGDRGIA